MNVGEVLLWTIYIMAVVALIWIWVRVIFDLFSDHETGGWAKFSWTVFLIFLPWLAVFVYLIARGGGMNKRAMEAAMAQKAATDNYIQGVAAQSKPPSEQISEAKGLLDSGAITQQEFDQIKAKALG